MTMCKLEFKRGFGLGKKPPLVVSVIGGPSVTLETNETQGVFHYPQKDTAEVEVSQDGQTLLRQSINVEIGMTIHFRIGTSNMGFLDRLRGTAPLEMVEVKRERMKGWSETLSHQMWIGRADTEAVFYDFLGERPEYFSEENEDAEGTPEHMGLSAFAESQGEVWYDHDFMEIGVARPGEADFDNRFSMSWAHHWAPVVRKTIDEKVWRDANVVVLVGIDCPSDGPVYRQFNTPQDVDVQGIALTYVGEITHPRQ